MCIVEVCISFVGGIAMERVQIMLAEGQNEKLTFLAKKLKTTKSKLVREAIDIGRKEGGTSKNICRYKCMVCPSDC